jgi:hypothetical protein
MAGGLLMRKWSARQATINRRATACGKGVGYTFRRAKPSPYKIEGEGGRFGSTKRKTSSCVVVCTMLCSQEDEIKKSANVRALPGGGGML